MTLLAVSLCNPANGDAPTLLVVDTRDDSHRSLALDTGTTSASGLAHDGERLYCAYTSEGASHLAILDRGATRVEARVRIPDVHDVHSIALDGDAIVAVSTGSDAVVRVSLADGQHETVWRASAAEADTHHLNALVWHEGRLLCSGFGPKMGPAWADALDGYVFDLHHSRYVLRGIYHPHSLAAHDGDLYLCESSLGTLRSQTHAIRYVDGYARGLAIERDGTYYCATSVARGGSRTPGLFNNPADAGVPSGSCSIHIGNLHAPERRTIALGRITREIYDVLVLPGVDSGASDRH